VAESTPDDLSREIDRLWARVGSGPLEPSSAHAAAASPPTEALVGAEVAWETVGLLKRQQTRREEAWRRAAESKEEALRVLRERADFFEAEAASLRSRVESEDERSLTGALDAQQKIESSQKAAELSRARHEEERRVLEEALQSLRERLAAETSRARASEQRWQSREQQYLLDLKELQSLAERREKDAARADESSRAQQARLAEAKNALEKTLAELLLERRESERARTEREEALKKVEDLRRHVDELSRIWEEERAQWRELWDRERSTWETQRQELAHWEENLRTEREAWHAELQAKEKVHLELTESLSGKIRETSQTAERMSGLLQSFDEKSSQESARSAGLAAYALEEQARRRGRESRLLRGAAVFASLVLLAAGARPAWRWATAWTYELESSAPCPVLNPTALALGGGALWIGDWGGQLVSADPADPRRVLSRVSPAPGGPYRPVAVALGSGMLWTLDAAQARLTRQAASDPAKILSARPTPGPAPVALAYDGQTVWSYDAVNRAVTRHGGDESALESFPLASEVVPNAMVWVEGRLWIHDSKSGRLLLYTLDHGVLVLRGSQVSPEAGVIGLAVAGARKDRRVYALLGASSTRSQPSVARYRLKPRLFFAEF